MTSALEWGRRKVDKSTDKLRDHVCDKGEGVKKFEIFMDVIDGSPLNRACTGKKSSLDTGHD